MKLPKIDIIKVELPEGEKLPYSKHGNKKAYCLIGGYERKIYTPIAPIDKDSYRVFDSILEARIYLHLRDLEHRSNYNLSTKSPTLYFVLERQVAIDLLPRDNELKLTHVVDFTLTLKRSTDKELKTIATWYIEAKGKPTPEAIIKWKVLESNLGLFRAGLYFVIGTPKKQVKTILNHSIYPLQQGIDALEKSINDFLAAYESINGRG